MRHLNFIPESYHAAKKRETILARCTFLLAALAIAIACLGVHFFLQAKDLKLHARSLDRGMAEHNLTTKRLGLLRKQHDGLKNDLALNQKLNNSMPVATLIVLVERYMPPSIGLADFSIQRQITQTPVTGKKGKSKSKDDVTTDDVVKITMHGIAPNDTDVARFVSELSAEDVFQGVRLIRSEPLKLDRITGKKFEIQAEFSLNREIVLISKVAN